MMCVDANQDGKVESDEIPIEVRDRWSRLFRIGDRNRDGDCEPVCNSEVCKLLRS